MPYTPAVGDRVRLMVEGPVTQFDPATRQVKVGNAALGAVNFALTDQIVQALEPVLPPEDWRVGDVVMDAEGKVYRRTPRETWLTFGGNEVFHIKPPRPLALLVRDGRAQ